MFARSARTATAPLDERDPEALRHRLAAAMVEFSHTPVLGWGRLFQGAAAAYALDDPLLQTESTNALAHATIVLGEFAVGIALLRSLEPLDFAGTAAIAHALTEQRRLLPARQAMARAAAMLEHEPSTASLAQSAPTFERLAARLAHYDWQRDSARTHAERALELSAGDGEQEALSTLELARHLALYDPERALDLAGAVEGSFAAWKRPVDVCHARHVQALALQQMGRYA
ncbi:MAG: hypothetical protein ACRC1H_16655, partial [Caldilineaceae bacterium]